MGWMLDVVGRKDHRTVTGLASLLLFSCAVDVPRELPTRHRIGTLGRWWFGPDLSRWPSGLLAPIAVFLRREEIAARHL